ncbi:MAG: hypothetical protein Q8O93_03590 [bacterium]|nr:hypothetical protein [bacterium]
MDRIKIFVNYLKLAIINHKLALVGAMLVGLIYVLPNIFFIVSLGENYHGIPMMQTANEDFYLARIQKIMDGHSLLGPAVFYENRQIGSLTPAGGEIFYALLGLLFHQSAANILIASRFILPFILFLLIYSLIRLLTADISSISNKINAIAGALFITLGYDLIDFKTAWLFLTGHINGGNFLIWTRPVNPVMGGIFLFSFLLCLWIIIKRGNGRKNLIIIAGSFLALAIYTYFFSWGVAVSVLAILTGVYLLEKRYGIVKSLAFVGVTAAALTSPYWYFNWRLGEMPGYREVMLRNGLFYTHYPLLNKVLMAALAFYLLIVIILFIKRNTLFLWNEKLMSIGLKNRLQDWFVFSAVLLLGGFWALNQQVVTGRTVWPFHFVQYTIPLSIIAVIVLFYNLLISKWPGICRAMAISVIIISLSWGIFSQVKIYRIYYDYYAGMQAYGPLFDWLNSQPKDNVVFVLDESNNFYNLNGLVPAFTHSNVYSSTWAYNIIDPNRIYDSFLSWLRLKGVEANQIDEYLKQNPGDAVAYLFSNWKTWHHVKLFPDISDPLFEERLKQFPENYRKYYALDFRQALKKYRLDYIVAAGDLKENVKKQLPGLKLIQNFNGVRVYQF